MRSLATAGPLALTIATMPALIGSGRVGQAATMAVKAGDRGPGCQPSEGYGVNRVYGVALPDARIGARTAALIDSRASSQDRPHLAPDMPAQTMPCGPPASIIANSQSNTEGPERIL